MIIEQAGSSLYNKASQRENDSDTMASNFTKRKKPMAAPAQAVPRKKKCTPEEQLVDDLMKISERVLRGVSPSEREARLKKLNAYIASLSET